MPRPLKELEANDDERLYQGSLLRQERLCAGVSVSQAAERIGFHPASLYKLETNQGPINQRTIQQLSAIYGTPSKILEEAPVHPRLQKKLELPEDSHQPTDIDTNPETLGRVVTRTLEALPEDKRELAGKLVIDFMRSLNKNLGQ